MREKIWKEVPEWEKISRKVLCMEKFLFWSLRIEKFFYFWSRMLNKKVHDLQRSACYPEKVRFVLHGSWKYLSENKSAGWMILYPVGQSLIILIISYIASLLYRYFDLHDITCLWSTPDSNLNPGCIWLQLYSIMNTWSTRSIIVWRLLTGIIILWYITVLLLETCRGWSFTINILPVLSIIISMLNSQ